MPCTLKAKRKKVNGRLIVMVERTDAGTKRRNPDALNSCSDPECRVCPIFHGMFVQDIERKVPSLASDSDKTTSDEEEESGNRATDQNGTDARNEGQRRKRLRKMSPYEMYRRSCLDNGYDPQELEEARKARDLRKRPPESAK